MDVPRKSVFREYFEALLIAGIFLGFSNTFVVKTFYIPSGSMKETLLIGDHLFVNRLLFGPSVTEWEQKLLPEREVKRGDVVIFRAPENPTTDLVKRCIGLPGDVIEVKAKQLWVNGELAKDDDFTQHTDPRTFPDLRILSRQQRLRDNFGPFTVPEGHYFFLGDNRDESYDSRFWGAVPRHYLKGRALMIYWSYGGETPDGTWSGWGQKLGQVGRTLLGFPTKTRWSRSFHVIR
jgi:signal peptidase I